MNSLREDATIILLNLFPTVPEFQKVFQDLKAHENHNY